MQFQICCCSLLLSVYWIQIIVFFAVLFLTWLLFKGLGGDAVRIITRNDSTKPGWLLKKHIYSKAKMIKWKFAFTMQVGLNDVMRRNYDFFLCYQSSCHGEWGNAFSDISQGTSKQCCLYVEPNYLKWKYFWVLPIGLSTLRHVHFTTSWFLMGKRHKFVSVWHFWLCIIPALCFPG